MMYVVEAKCTMLHMYFKKFPLPNYVLSALLRVGLLDPWCTVHPMQARHFVLHISNFKTQLVCQLRALA